MTKLALRADLKGWRIPCEIHDKCYFGESDIPKLTYIGPLIEDESFIGVAGAVSVHVLYSIDLDFTE